MQKKAAQLIGHFTIEVRARVCAVSPSKVPEVQFLAFGKCNSALVDLSLLIAAARDGVGLTKYGGHQRLKPERHIRGERHGRLRPRRQGCRGDRVAKCEGALCAGDDACLTDDTLAPSAVRKTLEALGGAPDYVADAFGVRDLKLMTLGEKPGG